jgi:hypothetical protein
VLSGLTFHLIQGLAAPASRRLLDAGRYRGPSGAHGPAAAQVVSSCGLNRSGCPLEPDCGPSGVLEATGKEPWVSSYTLGGTLLESRAVKALL